MKLRLHSLERCCKNSDLLFTETYDSVPTNVWEYTENTVRGGIRTVIDTNDSLRSIITQMNYEESSDI
jgi:hypothetical protein